MALLLTCMPVVIGYLLGSIPAGYLAGRVAKIDIREHGSGNIGATNVLRVLGKPWGFAVFAFDFLKGVAAVMAASFIDPTRLLLSPDLLRIIAAVAAVLGHAFPVWLGFRGGKAVATSLGVVSALAPIAAVSAVTLWGAVFAATRYVSVASLVAAAALPVVAALIELRSRSFHWPLPIFFFLLTLLIWVRHRSNIARLMRGTEPRFTRQ
jgi:glycerol-3-phosphate acyltransferase PlsY